MFCSKIEFLGKMHIILVYKKLLKKTMVIIWLMILENMFT